MSDKKEYVPFNPERDLIRCNLCQKEMLYSIYEAHYDKCLAIKTLLPILRDEGQKINYKDLNEYDMSSLNKLLEKHLPPIPEIKSKKG